ncbi:hypothetical protein KVH31_35040 [Streptomyces olivaceus]|uniref:hypothetical protein n=1 Tax=Streptomyces olivaceus TaxID=47716 RepID=UPI001CD0107E|nr:hypothetical protein [Streptomyces olivaceus]MBZ6211715.1 hypothetical protein [Streptomyces olivaceus]
MGDTEQPERRLHPAPAPDTDPDAGPPGGEEAAALQAWAETIEISFNGIDQSLTNPQTKAAFLRALDLWEGILHASRATDVIDDGQLARLLETLTGMRQAPNLL